ncbi:MAG: SAM-dependent chlorinase/fluorinase [Myxococcota bacterium]|jgi:S-adenosyl-L-methionine hydrolase (adenosine-forming)|nr:SAM-dependent chlorinase/fluorinase [Myxococcota bacterium]
MSEPGIVTLLTDFGLDDPYVGILKGVMLSIERRLTLVDVCHGVPPQNVAAGALWLAHAFSWFPPESVHLAVVDPGVGSERRALGVRASGHAFVAPDNGILSRVALSDPGFEARRIDAQKLGIEVPSRTFHGRDLFAKVAALWASKQLRFEELGPVVDDPVMLSAERPSDDGTNAEGRVLAVDRFGNLITDLPGAVLERAGAVLELQGRTLRRVATYAEAREGECVALVSSFGLVEVAARNQSAAVLLGVGPGARVAQRSEHA